MKISLRHEIILVLLLSLLAGAQNDKALLEQKQKLVCEVEKVAKFESALTIERASSTFVKNAKVNSRFEAEITLALRKMADVKLVDIEYRKHWLRIDQKDLEVIPQAFGTPIAKRMLVTFEEANKLIKDAVAQSFRQNYGKVFGEKYSFSNPFRPPEVSGITQKVWHYFPETRMCKAK